MNKLYCFIIAISIFTFPNLSSAGRKKNYIRVAVKKNVAAAKITSKSTFIFSTSGKRYRIPSSKHLTVRSSGQKLVTNWRIPKTKIIKILPGSSPLTVDGTSYRGKLEVVISENGRIIVINEIEIEDYLRGVLNNEVLRKWDITTFKAQAIIARTYALHQKSKKEEELYHLEASVADQVYKGSNSETDKANRAVKETSGMVLTYNGELALTVYHAVCGGHTEDAGIIWEGRSANYLKGVSCKFDTKAPRYSWKNKLSLSKIQKRLNKAGFPIKKILKITPLIFTKSGRVFRLSIEHTGGSQIIAGTDFRRILGYNLIRSTLFSITIDKGIAFFKGKGSGHGSGLCQWGANGMAEKGYTYKQILKHYYPGVKLERYYTL